MYHPALTNFVADRLRPILTTGDRRINVLASRLESSIVCPDKIAFHPATRPDQDSLLSLRYGSRTVYYTCVYHPIDGLVVDSHTVAPLTTRPHVHEVDLIVPLRSLLVRPFIFK